MQEEKRIKLRDLKITVTKLFFKHLVKKAKEFDYPAIKIVDKEFDNWSGYANSFKVEDIPDYLFGIWWDDEVHIETYHDFKDNTDTTENVEYLRGSFFGDYEREIDKFKPWRCYFNVEILVKVKDIEKLINKEITDFRLSDSSKSLVDILDKINFIRNEPELAFCTCWNGWDYNEKYHTRNEAKKEYEKYIQYKIKQECETNNSIKEQFNYFKALLDRFGFEQYKDYIIEDRCYEKDYLCSPRFELIMKCQTNWKKSLEGCNEYGYYGMYSLSDILANNDEDADKLYEDYKKFSDSLQGKCGSIFMWHDIAFWCFIVTPRRFSLMKKHKCVVDISQPEKLFKDEVFR